MSAIFSVMETRQKRFLVAGWVRTLGIVVVAGVMATGVLGQGKSVPAQTGEKVDVRKLGMSDVLLKFALKHNLDKLRLNDLEKQILEEAQRRDASSKHDAGRYAFQALMLMANPDWKSVCPVVKQGLIDGSHSVHPTYPRGTAEEFVVTDLNCTKIIYSPCVVNERTVFNWVTNRSAQAEMEYVTLPGTLKKGLTDADLEWAGVLLSVVNDNLNAWVTARSFRVTKDDILSGRLNGRMLNSVAGVFLKSPLLTSADKTFGKAIAEYEKRVASDSIKRLGTGLDAKLLARYQDGQNLIADLQKREVPESRWDMYAIIGYIGLVSDFDGSEAFFLSGS